VRFLLPPRAWPTSLSTISHALVPAEGQTPQSPPMASMGLPRIPNDDVPRAIAMAFIRDILAVFGVLTLIVIAAIIVTAIERRRRGKDRD
jgi:hypothetical protein